MTRVLLFLVAVASIATADPVTPYASTTDLYLLDDTSNSVIKVTPGGTPTVAISQASIIAVTGESQARFTDNGIAFNATGTMFFTDSASDAVLKYEGGVLTVLASESALATATGHDNARPEGITVGSDGFIYIVDDHSDGILRINPTSGAVTVFAPGSAFAALPGVSYISPDLGIVGAPGGDIFLAEDGNDILFRIDSTGTPSIVADSGSFSDFDVFMARAPNGDMIVADDAGGDVIWRIKSDGSYSVFLSEAAILAVIGGGATDIDLEGGIAFDSAGNFYLAEETSGNLLRFTPGLVGSIFVSNATFSSLIRGGPDWEGIAFAPGDLFSGAPEPAGLLLAALGMGMLAIRRRRRSAAA